MTHLSYSLEHSTSIINRIKTMASIPTSRRNVPQDGSIQVIIDTYELDLRVSTMPSVFGESLVVRLLDKAKLSSMNMKSLGFSDSNSELITKMLKNPNGIICITGKTGSGNSTTALTLLKSLATGERSIRSIEDPVEYKVDGILASNVNEARGLSFAASLRALMRQDPDILYIGETRDLETATIAVNGANIGQLLLTTLHTNNAILAVTRLLDLGVKRFQLVDTFIGATAQVLTRKVCPYCSEEYEYIVTSDEDIKDFGADYRNKKIVLKRAVGCSECNNGYLGRTPLQEVFYVNESIRELLASERTTGAMLRKEAIKHGYVSLRHDGIAKAIRGLTSLEEVRRVTVNYD